MRSGASREGGEPPRAVAADHRAARVMRVRISHDAKPRTAPRRGGAMGTSRPTAKPRRTMARAGFSEGNARAIFAGVMAVGREAGGPAADHRAARVMRVRISRDAKPRTAPMARRRDGDIAPYRNGTAPRGTGVMRVRISHDAKPRTAVARAAAHGLRAGGGAGCNGGGNGSAPWEEAWGGRVARVRGLGAQKRRRGRLNRGLLAKFMEIEIMYGSFTCIISNLSIPSRSHHVPFLFGHS